jgi:hypothetical protein
MTGISLHMQWPLASQSDGSFLKEDNCCFFSLRMPLLGVSPPSLKKTLFDQGPMIRILKYFRQKMATKFVFLFQLVLVYAKIEPKHSFLRKTPILSPKIGKDRRK